jgi:hypothetical protein
MIKQLCENCRFWAKLPDQKEGSTLWGICHGRPYPLADYIRPVPAELETVGPFGCNAFFPAFRRMRLQDKHRKRDHKAQPET